MNFEKCYLLGEALTGPADPEEERLAAIDRPPGAANYITGAGIVACLMEDSPPPPTIQELRNRIRAHGIPEDFIKLAQRAVIYLMSEDILKIGNDRSLTYNRPSSPVQLAEYLEALELPDY